MRINKAKIVAGIWAAVLAWMLMGCQSGDTPRKSHTFPPETQSKEAMQKELEALQQRVEADPKDVNAHAQLGYLYGQLGNVTKEVEHYREALALYPEYKEIHYNLACAYTDLGQKEKALASLARALELGFSSRQLLETDSDLDALRSEPRFKKLMQKHFEK
jgi:tetratricopeptide (TPR) repeat protein